MIFGYDMHFFELSKSNNDINVLEQFYIFSKPAQRHALSVNYLINDNDYTMGYSLVNGIYPKWSTSVKTILPPLGQKRKLFAKSQKAQEGCKACNVIGVLQAPFAFVCGPT